MPWGGKMKKKPKEERAKKTERLVGQGD